MLFLNLAVVQPFFLKKYHFCAASIHTCIFEYVRMLYVQCTAPDVEQRHVYGYRQQYVTRCPGHIDISEDVAFEEEKMDVR